MSFNLYGPINDFGYGIFTRGIINGLLENSIKDFSLSPIGQITLEDTEEAKKMQKISSSSKWIRKNPSVAIWHEFDLNKFSSNKLVAYPIFETDSFNTAAINYLSQMDAIFVLSNWAKTVIIKNIGNIVPVYVIQGASDEIGHKYDHIINTRVLDTFTFFSAGKYEMRKSPVETILAYIQAFRDKQADTRLIYHCFNPFDRNFATNMVEVLKRVGLKIMPATSEYSIVGVAGNAIVEVPTGKLTRDHLFSLMGTSQAGIFPARAEGWNLPLMETIKFGIPCIATNYSAHTEYLTEEFSYPKELLLTNLTYEIANDGQFFRGDRGGWMKPSVDEIAQKMNYVHDNYHSIKEKFNADKIKEHFTWKNTAKQLVDTVSTLND